MKLSDLDLYDPARYEMSPSEWFYYESVNRIVEGLECDLAAYKADLAKCRDQYKDLTEHYMEMKEQRDAARASMKYYREEIGALTEERDALRDLAEGRKMLLVCYRMGLPGGAKADKALDLIHRGEEKLRALIEKEESK